jgi:hypothetical protein
MFISETTYPGSNAAPVQLTRLKRRLTNLQLLLSGLEKQAGENPAPETLELVNRARANSLTAGNLVGAADLIANQTALEALRTDSVKVEVTVVSFEDVIELAPLKLFAAPLPSQTGEAQITFEGRSGSTTCAAPDPSKWFEQLQAPTDKATVPAACESPRVAVELPIDLNSKITRVDELIKLTESTILLAEGQIRQARTTICHDGGASCSI